MDTMKPPEQSAILPNDGAVIDIGPSGIRMLIQLTQIEETEIRSLRRGKLEIGVLSCGQSGILLTRFDLPDSRKGPLVFDTPFHWGLVARTMRHLPPRTHGSVHGLLIQIQDETGGQHGARLVSLSPEVCAAIEELIYRQARLAESPAWGRQVHDREINAFYAHYTDLAQSADQLFAQAHARQTFEEKKLETVL